MSAFQTNANIWSEIYNAGQNNLSYPNENLVRYFHYLFANKKPDNLKLLDYGFGSGANLKHLKNFGFDVYGLEVSSAAIEMTLSKMGPEFDKEKLLLLEDNLDLKFPENYFDIIVAWQVLYYNSFDSLLDLLDKLYALLKPGGFFIGTMARNEDYSIVNSDAISKFERISNGKLGNQKGSRIISVSGEEDIKLIFKVFNNIEIGYFETKLKDIVGSHWIIYGEK